MSGRISSALTLKGNRIACTKCGEDLGSAENGWKSGAVVKERPMNNAGGVSYKSRGHVLLRLFFCPGCGKQLGTETAMKDDPFLQDVLKTG